MEKAAKILSYCCR